jgi:hypothetical protein
MDPTAEKARLGQAGLTIAFGMDGGARGTAAQERSSETGVGGPAAKWPIPLSNSRGSATVWATAGWNVRWCFRAPGRLLAEPPADRKDPLRAG